MTGSKSAYLLAAGNGARSGGPKAWRENLGKSLLQTQVDFLLERFAPKNIAVSIQDGWQERCRAIHPQVNWVPVDPALKPMASLIALVGSGAPPEWGYVYHVDMPVWVPEVFDALDAAVLKAEAPVDAVVPVYVKDAAHPAVHEDFVEGKRGHPAVLSKRALAAIRALDPATDRLDGWLRSRTVREQPVPYSCILENWNHVG